jgi:hypothetical protein
MTSGGRSGASRGVAYPSGLVRHWKRYTDSDNNRHYSVALFARNKARELPRGRHYGRIQVCPQALYNMRVANLALFRNDKLHVHPARWGRRRYNYGAGDSGTTG